jgi:hypothetical protein
MQPLIIGDLPSAAAEQEHQSNADGLGRHRVTLYVTFQDDPTL